MYRIGSIGVINSAMFRYRGGTYLTINNFQLYVFELLFIGGNVFKNIFQLLYLSSPSAHFKTWRYSLFAVFVFVQYFVHLCTLNVMIF